MNDQQKMRNCTIKLKNLSKKDVKVIQEKIVQEKSVESKRLMTRNRDAEQKTQKPTGSNDDIAKVFQL